MAKKTGADAVQQNALGHNKLNDQAKGEFLKSDINIVDQIKKLNEDRKELLREAKESGMSKMAIRAHTKEYFMSDEQHDVKKEIESEKKDYAKIWKEVFGNADKQNAA